MLTFTAVVSFPFSVFAVEYDDALFYFFYRMPHYEIKCACVQTITRDTKRTSFQTENQFADTATPGSGI